LSAGETHVLFFGDSHTIGVGDPSGLGWVGHVVAASHAAGVPLVAYNLGIRRETSRDVLRRWRGEAEARSYPVDTKVVFAVGANDTTEEDGVLRVVPNKSVETLAALLRQSATAGFPAMVVGPAPVGDRLQMERIATLSDRFVEVCEQMGVPFVNLSPHLTRSETWREEIGASDEAHPAAAGYEELARIVLDSGWLGWLGAEASGGAGGG
jgi:lysophospholipase L1-like esterase